MNKNGTRILFQDKITTRLFFLTKFIHHKSTAYSNAFDDFSLKKKRKKYNQHNKQSKRLLK